MLRRRPESNFEMVFFGSLFASAAVMVGHGLAQSVLAPMMAHSAMAASIANGFAHLWVG